ncbi:MAG TPA: GNAT family N-acetyltransferase [Allocoleopsis sp.]
MNSTSFEVQMPPENWTLPNGTKVLLRNLQPTDLALHQQFLFACSSESLYQRFFKAVNQKKLTERKVSQWTDYDRLRELAIAAIQHPNHDKELGVVRLICIEPGVAEFALLVADAWQGQGLGRKLTEKAIAICQANGIRCLRATVLNTNQTMLHLARRLGFTVLQVESGLCEISRQVHPIPT